MTPAEIVGWAGALTALSIGIPQAFRLLRTRNTAGLSVVAWQAILTLNIGWLVHGILIDAPNMILPNAVSVIVSTTVLLLLRQERQLNALTLLAPVALGAGVMVAADLTLGSTWFGVTAILASLIANAGQGISLAREPSITGVAPGFLIIQLVNQVVWVGWGLMVADSGTVISAIFTGLIALFNTVWWILRRLGMRPLFVRPVTAVVETVGAARVSCES